ASRCPCCMSPAASVAPVKAPRPSSAVGVPSSSILQGAVSGRPQESPPSPPPPPPGPSPPPTSRFNASSASSWPCTLTLLITVSPTWDQLEIDTQSVPPPRGSRIATDPPVH